MCLSPFVFLLVKEGKLVLWDYKLHNQFEITEEYLAEIQRISAQKNPLKQAVFSELVENQIIVDSKNHEYFEDNWEWDELAKIFHLGTQLTNNTDLSEKEYAQSYLEDCEEITNKLQTAPDEREGSKFILPKPKLKDLSRKKLLRTLFSRHTSRQFEEKSLSLESVSTLLNITFSTFDRKNILENIDLLKMGMRRTSPSGGGLHPSNAYLISLNVDNLNKGVYHYNCEKHLLTKVNDISQKENLSKILHGQYFSNKLSAGILITSDFKKQWHKYPHSRAYRIALLDIGHLSQTLLLCATAMDISTWMSGAFDDEKMATLLDINSISERPILFIGLGYGNNCPIDTETLKILNEKDNHE